VPTVKIRGQLWQQIPLIGYGFRPKVPQVVMRVADGELGLQGRFRRNVSQSGPPIDMRAPPCERASARVVVPVGHDSGLPIITYLDPQHGQRVAPLVQGSPASDSPRLDRLCWVSQ